MDATATQWSLQNSNGNYSTFHNTTGATATISMGRLCSEGPMEVRAQLGPTLYRTNVNCHPRRPAPTPDVMDNGPLHRLVRMTDGTLYQQNGNNSAHSELVTPVAGLDGGVMTGVSNKIAACQQDSLAVLNDGRVVAISAQGGGSAPRPQFVVTGDGGPPLGNAVNVFCGEYSAAKFVELDGGFLFGWGQNDKYQLGLGDRVDRAYPTFVPRPASLEGPLKDMAITSENTLAWRDAQANQLAIWGSNGPNLHLAFPDGGPLFDSGYPPGVYAQPVSFPTAHPDIQSIAAGDLALFITGTNGLVYAWGRDTNVAQWFPQGRYPWGVPYQITLTSPDAGAQLNLTDVARAEPGAAYYWEFIPNTNNFSAALSNTGQIYTWGYMGSVGTGLGWVPKPPAGPYPLPGLVAVPPARAMDIFGGTGMSISQNTNDIWLWGDLTGGGAWLDAPFQMGIYGCGNGVLEAGEQCDDNNWTSSIQDGCGVNSAGVSDGRICRVGFFVAEAANSATSPQVITLPAGATTRGVNGTLTTVATENDFFRATVGPNQVLSAQLLDGCHDGVNPTYAVLSPSEQPLTSCAVGQLNCRLDCSPINIPNPTAGDWTFQVFGTGPGTNHTYRMVITIRDKGFGDP